MGVSAEMLCASQATGKWAPLGESVAAKAAHADDIHDASCASDAFRLNGCDTSGQRAAGDNGILIRIIVLMISLKLSHK